MSLDDKIILTRQMKYTFGEYIRKLRNEKGFTLTQLAAKLDMDSANLSKVENGKREFDYRRLEALCHVFLLNFNEIKDEYFSEQMAKTILQNNLSDKALELAEEKAKYYKLKNLEQGKIDF